jgi:hypothetical protein
VDNRELAPMCAAVRLRPNRYFRCILACLPSLLAAPAAWFGLRRRQSQRQKERRLKEAIALNQRRQATN